MISHDWLLRWRRVVEYLCFVCVHVLLSDADETADAHVAEFALSNQRVNMPGRNLPMLGELADGAGRGVGHRAAASVSSQCGSMFINALLHD